ncbi:MAG: hypothetical protein ACLPUO_06890 [Streptosporangiaceae bacterium]
MFFRNPRPDAADPGTGERYQDVIVFWVPSESDKQALVQDQASPFFTTSHFDGHPSVLVRASRIGELTRQELTEVVQDAWLSQASPGEPRPGSAHNGPTNGIAPADGHAGLRASRKLVTERCCPGPSAPRARDPPFGAAGEFSGWLAGGAPIGGSRAVAAASDPDAA